MGNTMPVGAYIFSYIFSPGKVLVAVQVDGLLLLSVGTEDTKGFGI